MDDSDRKSNSSWSTSNKQRPSIPKSVDENGKSYKTKHFMSPTVSATSKFTPKKKILAERNDSLDNQQKTPDPDSKSVHKAESFNSDGGFRTESGESGEKSRPRFLRYNPNRRREILNQRESEEKEGENDDVAPNSALDPVIGPLAQLEGGEIEESDDEFEEVEDERGWGFMGFLKLMTLLLVLVFFTSYIVSMNSPTPSPVVEAVICLRNGYQTVQDHVYGYINQNLGSFLVMEDKKILDLEAGNSVGGERREEETEFEGEISDSRNSEMMETVEIVQEPTKEETEFDGEISDSRNSEMMETVEIVQKPIKEETEFEGGISDSRSSEMMETVEIVQEPIKEKTKFEGEISDSRNSEMMEPIKDEIFEGETVSIGNPTGSHKIGDAPGNSKIKWFAKHLEAESVVKAVIGLSVALFAVIASVLLTLKYRNPVNARESTLLPAPVNPEPCMESPALEDEEHPIESAANVLTSESLKHLEQDRISTQGISQSQWSLSHESRAAPTMKLLGEIEVAEMSTSLRSCGIKNSRVIDSEVSSHFSSIKETTTIFSTPPVSSDAVDVQTPPSAMIPAVSYPSHSNEKKQMKNKANETTPLRRSSRLRNRVTSP